MPVYHRNTVTLAIEACDAFVSCPHGDINADHFTDPGQLGAGNDLDKSLELFGRVRELSTLCDEAEAAEPGLDLTHARLAVASLSYRAGCLVKPDGDGVREFRASLARAVEAFTDALGTASCLEATLPLVRATNLLAELGSTAVLRTARS